MDNETTDRNIPMELINLGCTYDGLLEGAFKTEPGDPRAEVANLDKFFLKDVVELIGFKPADAEEVLGEYEFNERNRYFNVARAFVESALAEVTT